MLDTIILVIDGAEQDSAMPPAGALAARLSGRVVVIPVTASRNGRAVDANALRDRLEAEVTALRGAGVDAVLGGRVVTRRGAAAAIAKAARAHGAGLIVVTGGGYRPAPGTPSHAIAGELLHTAPCPVVSVPAGRPRGVAAA
jgi:uncharacterized SAM-binding protein YcdF (DUF218 family)